MDAESIAGLLGLGVGLLVLVPGVLLTSWALVNLARRTWLSVALTGKPSQPHPQSAVHPHRRWLRRASVSGIEVVIRSLSSSVPSL